MALVETAILGAILKIISTTEQMHANVVDVIYNRLNKKIRANASQMLYEIKNVLREAIYSSDTYNSLTSGTASERPLRGHFGFPEGQEQAIVDPIVEAFVESLDYEFRPFRYRGGHFRIHGIASDYMNILSLPTAKIHNTGKAGGELPWLFWLLRGGMGAQISDYRVAFSDLSLNPTSRGVERYSSGRSKIALMYKVGGAEWVVPAEFAGTENDNWITRLIGSTNPKSPFYSRVEQIFSRNLEL